MEGTRNWRSGGGCYGKTDTVLGWNEGRSRGCRDFHLGKWRKKLMEGVEGRKRLEEIVEWNGGNEFRIFQSLQS